MICPVRLLVIVIGMLVAGCSLTIVPKGDLNAPPANDGSVLVFGRVTYVIDGETKLPFGPFRPAIPAPHLDLLQLESGDPFQTLGVNGADGSYAWRLQPGHYIISGIGQGQFQDDYRIAWPRLAFEVKSGAAPVYLGHLELIGTRFAEPYTLSTGTQGVSRGIRYRFEVKDELEQSGRRPLEPTLKALMVHRANMPIGERLVERWRVAKEQLIGDLFGSNAQLLRPR